VLVSACYGNVPDENVSVATRFEDISVYEMDDVTLECSTELKMLLSADWSIVSAFQRQLGLVSGRQLPRRIYTNCEVIEDFEMTDRYVVTRPSPCEDTNIVVGSRNYYNMTIVKLNLSETGQYTCREQDGVGDTVAVYFINVLGKNNVRHVRYMFACFDGY